MTNTSNNEKKIFVLEWENTELKDGTMPYEKFKIISGVNEQSLLFYSSFFTSDNKFKKGNIYHLSVVGNFIKDGEIVKEIDNGSHEFQQITPSLLIKELWEEKKKVDEKLNLSEEDLKKKKEDVDKVNQKWLDDEKKISQFQEEVNGLRSEGEKKSEKLKSLEEELQKEKEGVNKISQTLVETKKELSDLRDEFSKIQFEKTKIENERMTPERQKHLLQEQENLLKELETEKREKQDLINQLEEIHSQEWKETIQAKLEKEKSKLSQLKISVSNKLEDGQKVFLETLLVIQEQFDNLIFEGVDQRICSPMKNQLQQTKDKLVKANKKISLDEIESVCKTQTEIIKLESQQKQWEKLEKIQEQEQQLRAYVEVN